MVAGGIEGLTPPLPLSLHAGLTSTINVGENIIPPCRFPPDGQERGFCLLVRYFFSSTFDLDTPCLKGHGRVLTGISSHGALAMPHLQGPYCHVPAGIVSLLARTSCRLQGRSPIVFSHGMQPFVWCLALCYLLDFAYQAGHLFG